VGSGGLCDEFGDEAGALGGPVVAVVIDLFWNNLRGVPGIVPPDELKPITF
jgi:hypothetical protein